MKLCRELRLKRPLHEMPKPFQPYQEFEGWDQLEAGGMVYSYGLAQDFDASVIQEEADPIWLPTLDDWLGMLEEEGVRHMEFDPGIDDWHCISIDFGAIETADTREEATAKLWRTTQGEDFHA